MNAVVIKEPGRVSLEQVEIPRPQPGFVLVKVKAAAVCATDLEVLDGNIPASYPLIPGHEWSGIVEEAGSGEDRHWIGKRVVGSNDVACLKCDACRSGNWRYCKEFEEIGFKRNGAYAEYVQVPAYASFRRIFPFSTAPFANRWASRWVRWKRQGRSSVIPV